MQLKINSDVLTVEMRTYAITWPQKTSFLKMGMNPQEVFPKVI